ncbi:hypothetical protein MG293_005058 [Ovis ammon polii]|uniref:Uncharacterized protein n=1 Tax=Ovis ammon polii TaxID=230172 RepID=A0AAD4UHN6_OVIAM|nr:hypothetical protein MG293_005058 [Ovis ammon polii]
MRQAQAARNARTSKRQQELAQEQHPQLTHDEETDTEGPIRVRQRKRPGGEQGTTARHRPSPLWVLKRHLPTEQVNLSRRTEDIVERNRQGRRTSGLSAPGTNKQWRKASGMRGERQGHLQVSVRECGIEVPEAPRGILSFCSHEAPDGCGARNSAFSVLEPLPRSTTVLLFFSKAQSAHRSGCSDGSQELLL